jgi:hypothetical protein
MSEVWAQVVWPAAVQHPGAEQLRVVKSRDDWDIDPTFHAWPYHDDDRFIDGNGIEYRFNLAGMAGVEVEPTGRRYSRDELLALVEAHLSTIDAPVEFLTAYLEEFPEAQRGRAAFQYLSKFSKAESPEGEEEDE